MHLPTSARPFRHHRFGSVLCAVLALATLSAPAHAAGEAPAVEADDAGTIVVTARRRAEDPQKVPIPLTVFGGKALEQRGFY
ncbi:MAG: hypothetical protein JWR77_2548, partial [Rhizorhabdus sp.]|nr:hypothetical protein [Rhizorhabdus sp.]